MLPAKYVFAALVINFLMKSVLEKNLTTLLQQILVVSLNTSIFWY